MIAPDDPFGLSALEAAYYLGGFVAAFLAFWYGYWRKQPPAPAGVAVAGALVDNSALQPLLQKFDALIGRLDKLTSVLEREVELRKAEVEEETQQRRVDEAVRKAIEILMKTPPAEMPAVRR